MAPSLNAAMIAGIAAGSAVVLLLILLATIIPLLRWRHNREIDRKGGYTEYPESRFYITDDVVERIPGTRSSICRPSKDAYTRLDPEPPYTPMISRTPQTSLKHQSPTSRSTRGTLMKPGKTTPNTVWSTPRRLKRLDSNPVNNIQEYRHMSGKKSYNSPIPSLQADAAPPPTIAISPASKESSSDPWTPPSGSDDSQPQLLLHDKPAEILMSAKSERGTSGTRLSNHQVRSSVVQSTSAKIMGTSRSRSSSLWSQPPGSAPSRPVSPLPPGALERLKKTMVSLSPKSSLIDRKRNKAKKKSVGSASLNSSPIIPEVEKTDWDLIDQIEEEIQRGQAQGLLAGARYSMEKSVSRSRSSTLSYAQLAQGSTNNDLISMANKKPTKPKANSHLNDISNENTLSSKLYAPLPLATEDPPSANSNNRALTFKPLREVSVNLPRSLSSKKRQSIFPVFDSLDNDPNSYEAPANIAIANIKTKNSKHNSFRVSKSRRPSGSQRPPSRKRSIASRHEQPAERPVHSRSSSHYSYHCKTTVFRPPSAEIFQLTNSLNAKLNRYSLGNPYDSTHASPSKAYTSFNFANPRLSGSTSSTASPISTPTKKSQNPYRIKAMCRTNSSVIEFIPPSAEGEPADFPFDAILDNLNANPPARTRTSTLHSHRRNPTSPSRHRKSKSISTIRSSGSLSRSSISPTRFPAPPPRDRTHTLRSSIRRSQIRNSGGSITNLHITPPNRRSSLSSHYRHSPSLNQVHLPTSIPPRNNRYSTTMPSGDGSAPKSHTSRVSASILALRRMNSDAEDNSGGRGSKEHRRYVSLGESSMQTEDLDIFGPVRSSHAILKRGSDETVRVPTGSSPVVYASDRESLSESLGDTDADFEVESLVVASDRDSPFGNEKKEGRGREERWEGMGRQEVRTNGRRFTGKKDTAAVTENGRGSGSPLPRYEPRFWPGGGM